MRINLTDNNIGQSDAGTPLRENVAALFPIAGKTIAKLYREDENLLMFPYSIGTLDGMIGEPSIMSIPNTDDPDKVRITTGNMMGFIGVDNLQIEIKSRFDKGQDDYLLHYMLRGVLSFNLFNLNHNSKEEDVFDFIIFMFPHFLKAAIRRGAYREYQNFSHNNADLKGTIDIAQHIAESVPFIGNVAYSTKEYSHDNNMTELIRYAIEFMKVKRCGQSVLNIDRETIENMKAIVEHTPLYDKNERGCIIDKNLRVKAHPYFTEYRPLQVLYLQILRMDEVKYDESNSDICDILFDGVWLWGEYVNTILGDYDLKHPENELHKGGTYLFGDHGGIRYPDFYKDDMVLDTKYKLLDSYDKVSKVDSDGIHQVIAYMTALKVDQDGFVVPLNQKQLSIPTSHLKGSLATPSTYDIEISKADTPYVDFCENMKEMECVFVESLH